MASLIELPLSESRELTKHRDELQQMLVDLGWHFARQPHAVDPDKARPLKPRNVIKKWVATSPMTGLKFEQWSLTSLVIQVAMHELTFVARETLGEGA